MTGGATGGITAAVAGGSPATLAGLALASWFALSVAGAPASTGRAGVTSRASAVVPGPPRVAKAATAPSPANALAAPASQPRRRRRARAVAVGAATGAAARPVPSASSGSARVPLGRPLFGALGVARGGSRRQRALDARRRARVLPQRQHGVGRLGPTVRVLGEAAHHQIGQRPAHRLARARRPRHRLVQVGARVGGRARAHERRASGEHLVGDAAEGVDVGARCDGVADDLLGRHDARRADDDTGARERHARRALAGHLGDAEVEQLQRRTAPRVGHQEEVLGLQIAVDDAGRVGLGQRLEDLRAEAAGVEQRQRRLAAEVARERLALEVLHRQEQAPVLRLAELDELHDMRMVEPGDDARLLLEARDLARVARQLRDEDLQRHRPLDAELGGAIDGAEAASAEQALDAVAGLEDGAEARVVGRRGWVVHAG
ncbi:MAG: hypothetical protein U1F43_01615 [Myxococcota bacterium]